MSGMFGTGSVSPPDGGLKSPLARKSSEEARPEIPVSGGTGSESADAVRAVAAVASVARKVRNDGAGAAARSAAKKTAKKRVVSAVSKAGVVGADKVASRPTSAKAWGESAARTGVSWLLKPVGGKRSERIIAAVGYKRIVFSLAVISLLVMVLATACLAAAVDTVTKPAAAAQSVVDRILGRSSGDAPPPTERLCTVSPLPQPSVLDPASIPTTSRTATPTGTSRTSAPPAPVTFTPAPPMDREGHLTPAAERLMRQVPRNADPVRAETWLLYAMSHPDNDPRSGWDQFGDPFEKARLELRAPESDRTSGGDRELGRDSDPLALVMAIDDNPDYLPFVLPAATSVTALINDKKLMATSAQQESVIMRMLEACTSVSRTR